jgi:hypothetical protein
VQASTKKDDAAEVAFGDVADNRIAAVDTIALKTEDEEHADVMD